MRLVKVHVTNFRSIEDSGEFDVGQVLCLVGKNEAGKTAVQALAGLNPHPLTTITYDLERDYPRRWLTEYNVRHKGEQATVVTTKWEITEDEKAAIAAEIGDAQVTSPITISRRFADTEPRWNIEIDYKKAVENLIAKEKLDEEECKPVMAAKNSDDLRKALEVVKERTARQERLLQRLMGYSGTNVSGFVRAILQSGFPSFMYSSHYDRMAGQLRLDTYEARKSGRMQPPIEAGEQVFLDFLEYAGTSLNEITTAKTYESLNARCESASTHITQQLMEYWTQNPNVEIEVRVTKAEPGDTPPFNEGVIARARVKNNLHKLTLPFSERSAGFVWFFSFLVKFAQVQKTGGQLILLLDEPGLTLHGKAQADLLRYFDDKLAPKHQVVFTTHSPFMVPVDNLPSVRIVEDKIYQPKPGQWVSDGNEGSG